MTLCGVCLQADYTFCACDSRRFLFESISSACPLRRPSRYRPDRIPRGPWRATDRVDRWQRPESWGRHRGGPPPRARGWPGNTFFARRTADGPDPDALLPPRPSKSFGTTSVSKASKTDESRKKLVTVVRDRRRDYGPRRRRCAQVEGRRAFDVAQLHATLNAAHDRCPLIAAEVAGSAGPQLSENLLQQPTCIGFDLLLVGRQREVRLGPHEVENRAGNPLERQHEFTSPVAISVCGIPSYSPRRIRHDRQAAPFLDLPQPQRAVRAASGQDDADGRAIMRLGQRAKKVIDRGRSDAAPLTP